MRDIIVVFVHLIVTLVRLVRPGGLRSVIAESVLVKHQLCILNRGRKRAPNLRAADRIIAGLCTLFMHPGRLLRVAVVLKPSTLLHLHHALIKRKYRMLFSSKRGCQPGPKGPDRVLIEAVLEMKRRNPGWGCPRIAQQITLTFGVEIDKDVVRRILSVHHRPESDSAGPSWLTFLGHMKEQFVELRFVPLRIGHIANVLGIGGDGSVHTTHRRIWRAVWKRRWSGIVPDV